MSRLNDSNRPANPFGSRFTRPGAIAYVGHDQNTVAAIAQRVDPHGRSVIIGPHGSGKTTLLRALSPLLVERNPALHSTALPYVTLRQDEPHHEMWSALLNCPNSGFFVLDGAEQLSWLERYRLRRAAKKRNIGLLVTSHRPLLGFVPVHQTKADREISRDLASRLLQDFPEYRTAMLAEFDRQWTLCQGNVRQLWATLYDYFELHAASKREELS